ncbi:MAG TPA: hypothetical protein VL120_10785 [Solirubrobacteraceae bacterium]|nr:hypothetical protein [Solirubrobacteraceae bacterium]
MSVSAMRSFDPRRVGELEFRTWVTYYRRQWWPFLRAAVAVVRHAFGLPWPATLRGAWLVLRANRLWAPDDHDEDAVRRRMRGFYALVARHHGERFDVERAAWLEVEWWRAHREVQHGRDGEPALVEALVALYAHVYDVAPADVRLAAEQRALAMRHSDSWVAAGLPDAGPLLDEERAALVRSYAALLAAVHR